MSTTANTPTDTDPIDDAEQNPALTLEAFSDAEWPSDGHTEPDESGASETEATTRTTDRTETLDLPITAYPLSIANDTALEQLYCENGFTYAEIVTALDESVTESDVESALRLAGLLEPWDDPLVLGCCYEGLELSTTRIAEDICDGAVTSETIRLRLESFGIERSRHQPHLRSLMEAAEEQSDDHPEGDDSWERFTARGSTTNAES